MLLLYYIILPILEPSISFFVLYNLVTCDCNRCHTPIMLFVVCVTIMHDIISHSFI